jgi:hypothetical protein
MKHFSVKFWGEIPELVKPIIEKFDNTKVTPSTFYCLDDEIRFIVNDLGIAHGNTCKIDKTGWLSPRNGDNTWNMSIDVK